MKTMLLRITDPGSLVIRMRDFRLTTYLATSLLVLFFVLTTRWMGWNAGVAYLQAGDVHYSYAPIAEAAPAFPRTQIWAHHAQRWFAPYIAGLLAHFIGLGAAFSTLAFACVALTLLIAHRLLTQLQLSVFSYAICMGTLILNPYAFRYYAIAPGMVPDLLFIAGLAVTVEALTRKTYWAVIAGIALATMGRQTGILLLPGVAFWFAFGSGWKSLPQWRRALLIGLSVCVVTGLYTMNAAIGSSFGKPAYDLSKLMSVREYFSLEPAHAKIVLEHTLRVVIPYFILTGVTIGAVIRMRRERVRFQCSAEAYSCFLLIAGVCSQPFFDSPDNVRQSEARLGALGLFAAIWILATLFTKLDHVVRYTRFQQVLLFVVIAVGSLHHRYTVVGPSNVFQFFGLQISLSIAAAYTLARGRRPPGFE